MEILRAGQVDLPEILDLQKLAFRSEAEIYNDFGITPLTQTLEDLQQEVEDAIVLKAVEQGKIVGAVRVVGKDGTCYIAKVIVHPDYQNQGIGKGLVGAIEKCFEGFRYELFTGYRSEKNLALYEKLGYKRFKVESISDDFKFIYLEKVENRHAER